MSGYGAVATPANSFWLFNKLSGLLGAVVIGLIALLIGQIALDFFRDPARFPIHSVVVEGDYYHTDQNLLRERVLTQADSGFFNLDIAAIQTRLQSLPWVDKAYVRRIWPEGISVTLEEHLPVARWNSDGLISSNYDLFEPPDLDSANNPLLADLLGQLPQLQSPYRRHVAMLKLLKEIQPILDSADVPLVGIIEDDRRSVTLELQNGVQVIVGHEDIAVRVKRFARVFQAHVAPVYDDVLRVDMRHTNGFAMAHKSNNTIVSGTE